MSEMICLKCGKYYRDHYTKIIRGGIYCNPDFTGKPEFVKSEDYIIMKSKSLKGGLRENDMS